MLFQNSAGRAELRHLLLVTITQTIHPDFRPPSCEVMCIKTSILNHLDEVRYNLPGNTAILDVGLKTLSILSFPLSSSSTTSRELRQQFAMDEDNLKWVEK